VITSLHPEANVMDAVELGRTGIKLAPMGVGAMSWGYRSPQGYGGADSPADEEQALATLLAAGVTLVDTAEMYGFGRSERRVGELVRDHPDVLVATKYAPLPYRTAGRLRPALDRSRERLQRQRIDLYQVHFAPRFTPIPALMRQLAAAHADGAIRAVGVSNFTAAQLRTAHAALADAGVPLASNQVQYSLLHRAPEVDGVAQACRELGVTLIAYMPLASGALTGKYRADNRPGGIRRMMPFFRAAAFEGLEPVIGLLTEIGRKHDATPAQVALRWVIQQGAVPIPGAKNARQAGGNAAAMRIVLDDAEQDALAAATVAWRR